MFEAPTRLRVLVGWLLAACLLALYTFLAASPILDNGPSGLEEAHGRGLDRRPVVAKSPQVPLREVNQPR